MGPGGRGTPPVLASKHGALGAPYGPTVPLRECRRQFTLVLPQRGIAILGVCVCVCVCVCGGGAGAQDFP